MVEIPSRVTLIPRPADVNDQASIVLQNPVKFDSKRFEPVNIVVGVNVPVIFFRTSPKGGLVIMRLTELSLYPLSTFRLSPLTNSPNFVS